jgi:hypothetical protein
MLIKFILSDGETSVLRRLEDGSIIDELQVEVEDKFDQTVTRGEVEYDDILWYGKYLPKDEVRALLYDTFPEHTKGAIRGWLNKRWEDAAPRVCPKDGCDTAALVDEVEEKFGYRKIGGRPFPQSYCRQCRSAHKKTTEEQE